MSVGHRYLASNGWELDEGYDLSRKAGYLWRAVDHEGEVLASYVTKKRDGTVKANAPD
ncbi:MAG: DDE-type integrase/transposase/recombinase [Caenibius sp.]